MIIGEKLIFEVGDPVIDQNDAERRVGLVIAIEQDESGENVLLAEAEGNPAQTLRIQDKDAVLP
ncbi:hypothetical protein [Pseudomonas sp.]|uniref:hypothetical protein n=1 Tax=Pseudomonas sp. TaxID=306 RepID=UPI0028AB49FF|nr:hypothetical protein [Pseudomonas sp.]